MDSKEVYSFNEEGHLLFSGQDTVGLARRYGTPLYVVSQDIFEERAGRLRDAFDAAGLDCRIHFAGKSLTNVGILKVVDSLGLSLDVASGGELYVARAAGFPMERVAFHGSNKSGAELSEALEAGVGRIIVDSETELRRLSRIAAERGVVADILLRVNPGVDAHTNELINTGRTDTKFGVPIDQALGVAAGAARMDGVRLVGIHSHIGSQITEERPFLEAAGKMLRLYKGILDAGVDTLSELGLGGGFGVSYVPSEVEFDAAVYIPKLAQGLSALASELGVDLPLITIEPGRYISADSGITIYTVGTLKELSGIREYLSVDGGMADNPRPALYGAKYDALICDREPTEGNLRSVRVSGKACETDTLIEEIALADPKEGDFLAILKTGAYNYTMASNYNKLPRPAMVLLKGDRSAILCERETYEDLIKKDKVPEWLRT